MSPQLRGDVLPLLPFPLAAFAAGGDEGIRTPDPLLAKQVLCQLSYTPLPGTEGSSLQNTLKIKQRACFIENHRPIGICLAVSSRRSP